MQNNPTQTIEQILEAAAMTLNNHGLEYLDQPIDLKFLAEEIQTLITQAYERGRRAEWELHHKEQL